MLTTCPSALKMLLAKTSLKGSSIADEIETNTLNRRNLGYHPTFTVEFLKYYLGELLFWSSSESCVQQL